MFNDTKTIYTKKLYVGITKTGKKMYVELTINQESETRQAKTINLETITAYKTLSMHGNNGQNIEEIKDLISNNKELLITKEDLQTIVDIWKEWHLNDMNAGTEKQTNFIDEWKKSNKYDYSLVCEVLKKVNLYEDNNYKYGNGWLIKPITEDIITKIINIFEKYNKTENIEQIIDTIIYKNFKIKATFKGDKQADWNKDNYNNHLITVTNIPTKTRITFEFWNSINGGEINKEYNIMNAFYSFVSDAVAGYERFEDFCANSGYDEDSRTAEKIHKKCIKSYEKLNKIYDGDIYDLANELSENWG